MKKQILSFGCALHGMWSAICTEGHLRFHLTAGFYVLLFSCFYDFSAAQRAILVVLIGAVIAAELFNTALENACDAVTKEHNERIKMAKDAAAGAVLALAIAAAVVAVIFFGDFEVIKRIALFFIGNIPLLVLLMISAVLAVFFVWLGPREFFKKRKKSKD